MAYGLSSVRRKKEPTLFFTLAKDQTLPVFFLREIEDSLFVVEHHSAGNWKKKIVCTIDEGNCYGCERASQESFSGWAQKPKFYTEVMVGLNGIPAVMVQTMTVSSLTPAILAYYNEYGTIRNTWFNVTKSGEGKRTKYVPEPIDLPLITEYGKQNLNQQINKIPYNRQQSYLTN